MVAGTRRLGSVRPGPGRFSQLSNIYRLSYIATQEARKAETRQRLLDAAAELFATKGVHAVSLEAVADAAGRTTGAVYAHFGGKLGLLLALLDQTSRQVGRETRAALDGTEDRHARLDTLWQTFVARADDPDDAWMLLEHELWLFAARNPEARERLAERFRHTRQLMSASFETWVGDDDGSSGHGAMARDDKATLVLALLFGLEMQRRVDPVAVPDELAVDGLRALLQARTHEHESEPIQTRSNRKRAV